MTCNLCKTYASGRPYCTGACRPASGTGHHVRDLYGRLSLVYSDSDYEYAQTGGVDRRRAFQPDASELYPRSYSDAMSVDRRRLLWIGLRKIRTVRMPVAPFTASDFYRIMDMCIDCHQLNQAIAYRLEREVVQALKKELRKPVGKASKRLVLYAMGIDHKQLGDAVDYVGIPGEYNFTE